MSERRPEASNAASIEDAPERRRLAVARLVEGTEVLPAGGGTTLTADQCTLLLNYIEHLQRLSDLWKRNAAEWERIARKEAEGRVCEVGD